MYIACNIFLLKALLDGCNCISLLVLVTCNDNKLNSILFYSIHDWQLPSHSLATKQSTLATIL